MIRVSFAIFLLALLGCSAQLKENKFIHQSEQVSHYSDAQWQTWLQRYSAFSLQRLSLTVPNTDVSEPASALAKQLAAATSSKPVQLNGIYFDHPESDDVIYFLQGNGMTISDSVQSALLDLAKLKKDMVIFDRRGSGSSNGSATINNLLTDALAQFDLIKNQLSPNKIIVHGYSLGSFIAGQVVKHKAVDGLVLQGSATNVDEWIDAKMPWYSKLFFTVEVDEAFYQVDNSQVVQHHYQQPLLIIAGELDKQVPAELSNRLFALSQSANKQLLMVKGAGHQNMLDKATEIDRYMKFLTTIE